MPETEIWLHRAYGGGDPKKCSEGLGKQDRRGESKKGDVMSRLLLRALGFTPSGVPVRDPIENTSIVLSKGKEPETFMPSSIPHWS